ncbi:hypothetical protein PSPO01_05191 [Paraphaeosphaeria sporulosa]
MVVSAGATAYTTMTNPFTAYLLSKPCFNWPRIQRGFTPLPRISYAGPLAYGAAASPISSRWIQQNEMHAILKAVFDNLPGMGKLEVRPETLRVASRLQRLPQLVSAAHVRVSHYSPV